MNPYKRDRGPAAREPANVKARGTAGLKTGETAGLKARLYYLLLALADGARHGLAIARDVQQLSDGTVRLWPATLYGTLDELVERGWIEEVDAPLVDDSERKRFYQLTPAGRHALVAETERLAAVVKVARARLKRAGGIS
jgi:PadR family transcriptional regulator, regulatory protein PadR